MTTLRRGLQGALLALAACFHRVLALAQAPVKIAAGILTNDAGMTLCTFDKDAGDKSADGFNSVRHVARQ